jgi:uncharacterized membrane protein
VERRSALSERVADAITGVTGSMTFVLLHLVLFGTWIVANLGLDPLGCRRWDEELVVLAMIASVEAIFLSTFVLISQNRMMAGADQRADLDLQIGLLTEHEVTEPHPHGAQIAEHVGVDVPRDEVAELERNVAPEAVLDAIETTPDDIA